MVRPGGPGFVVAEAGSLVPIQPGDRFGGCAEGPLAEGLGRRGGGIEQCGSPSLPASDFGV